MQNYAIRRASILELHGVNGYLAARVWDTPAKINHYSLFMAIIALKKVNFICWDKIIYSYLKYTFIFGKSA